MQATTERVIVYIDGFNLYFGLKSSNWRRYYWLNLLQLAERLLKPQQHLEAVNYFTSRISDPPSKQDRQATYLEALATLPKLTITYGKYQSNPSKCPHCRRTFVTPNEKMTDVNIAVQMLGDAFQDRFDTAILISGDSDLLPPVTRVRSLFPGKRVVIAFPPRRHSVDLEAGASAYFTIGRKIVADSQLPEVVVSTSGFPLMRPARWR